MSSCCSGVGDLLGHGNKRYTAFLRHPVSVNAKMEKGIDTVIETLKKEKVGSAACCQRVILRAFVRGRDIPDVS